MHTDTSRNDTLDRRQSILDAAQDLIAREGLEGFRIREVAQQAGIHHASMLHYFPNREALIRGVVDQIVAQLNRVPAPHTAQTSLPPRDALHAHFTHVLAQIDEHPDHFVVLNELFVRAARDAEIRSVLHATDASWQMFLIPLLAHGIQVGAFRSDLDPAAGAAIIASFFKGLTVQFTIDQVARQQAANQLEHWICGEREGQW